MGLRNRVVGIVLFIALASGLLTACSSPRSPEAFCETYETEKAAFIEKYSGSTNVSKDASLDQVLGALFSGLASLGDAVVIFDKLDKVSPDDIEPDVARVRDSLQKQIDSAGDMASNPLGGLAAGLLTAGTSTGSWQRVSDFVTVHCEGGAPS